MNSNLKLLLTRLNNENEMQWGKVWKIVCGVHLCCDVHWNFIEVGKRYDSWKLLILYYFMTLGQPSILAQVMKVNSNQRVASLHAKRKLLFPSSITVLLHKLARLPTDQTSLLHLVWWKSQWSSLPEKKHERFSAKLWKTLEWLDHFFHINIVSFVAW